MQAYKKKKKKKKKEDLIFSHFIIYWDNDWWDVAVSSKKLHYFVRFLPMSINVSYIIKK
jgi:hypothetical protein